MFKQKGFTIIELIVALMILGILAALAVPPYLTNMYQGAAKSAQSNLIAIYNSQKNYYFSNGGFCTASCNTLANINTNLSLNISANNFQYTCTNAAGFTCTATNLSDGSLILKVTGGTVAVPNPIVLLGATGCTSSAGANPGCNPSCATDITSYCPIN